ncbi:hypothetical protein [Lysinibacillus sp. TE18511]
MMKHLVAIIQSRQAISNLHAVISDSLGVISDFFTFISDSPDIISDFSLLSSFQKYQKEIF